jgi:hypothetical protein
MYYKFKWSFARQAIFLFSFISLFASYSYAANIDVDASIQTRVAISLAVSKNMDFGTVDYEPVHTGTVQLATNDTVTLGGGSSGITVSGGSPAAAIVNLGGDGASIVEVSCEDGGLLTDGGANNLTLQNTEYSIDTGVAFGSGISCSGLGVSPTSIDLSANPTPKILLGGEIDVSGSAINVSAIYGTFNAGGNPMTVRVVYQ